MTFNDIIEEALKAAEKTAEENTQKIMAKYPGLQNDLEYIANRVGGDFGLKFRIGYPGSTTYFCPDTNLVNIDAGMVDEFGPESAKFLAAHEGGHRRITRANGDVFGMSDEGYLKKLQEPGFHLGHNAIEDCAVNDWVTDNFPNLKKSEYKLYEQTFADKADDTQKQLGYLPKVGQFSESMINEWFWGKYLPNLPFDVLGALKRTESARRDFIAKRPGEFSIPREINDKARERNGIYVRKIYPEIKKLAEDDAKTEGQRQAMQGMLQQPMLPMPPMPGLPMGSGDNQGQDGQDTSQDQSSPQDQNKQQGKSQPGQSQGQGQESQNQSGSNSSSQGQKSQGAGNQNQSESQRQSGGGASQDQKQSDQQSGNSETGKKDQAQQSSGDQQKSSDPFEKMSEESKREIREKSQQAKEELQKHLQEKMEQAQKDLNQAQAENNGREQEMQNKKQELDQKLQDLKNNKNLPVPFDKLSHEARNEIRQAYDELPKEVRDDLEGKAKQDLAKALDEIAQAIQAKAASSENQNPTQEEIAKALGQKSQGDDATEDSDDASGQDSDAESEKQNQVMLNQLAVSIKGSRDRAAQEMDSDRNAYEKIRARNNAMICSIAQQLQEVLVKQKAMEYKKGYASGNRVNMGAAMQAKADPRQRNKVMERKGVPQKYSYCFHVLIDASGSMAGEGAQRSFEGLVVISAVLARLKIKSSIVAFHGDGRQTSILLKAPSENVTEQDKETISRYTGIVDGGTPLAEAMISSYNLMQQDLGTANFLIVITDGGPNDEDAARAVIKDIKDEKKVKQFGIGLGSGTENVLRLFPRSFCVADISGKQDGKTFAQLLVETIKDMVIHPEEF